MGIRRKALDLLFEFPRFLYLIVSALLAVAVICQIGVHYSFNVNEGWNAYWASAAQSGSGLYPGPVSLTLNNYPPLWFYATAALGAVTADNVVAGRILAGLALFLNAILIGLIVREVAASKRSCWFGGAAFLTIFALFYGNYAGVDDGQILANLLMTVALLAFVRRLDRPFDIAFATPVVLLMLVAGLIKDHVLAVPISIGVFLMRFNRAGFVRYALCCCAGVGLVSLALYAAFGPNLFASVLLPRRYVFDDLWVQTADQVWRYGAFLLAIPFLGLYPGRKAKLIFIYSLIAFIQGTLLSGGVGVDVNVFFDFAVSICVGLGLIEQHIFAARGQKPDPGSWRNYALVAVWLPITLLPPILSISGGLDHVREVVGALTANPQRQDVDYIKSTAGDAACDEPAWCYWAGKKFTADLRNLPTFIWARPALLPALLAQIDACTYSLIELHAGWQSDDESLAQFDKVVDALTQHYVQVRKTATTIYLAPRGCGEQRIRPAN